MVERILAVIGVLTLFAAAVAAATALLMAINARLDRRQETRAAVDERRASLAAWDAGERP
ncbi:hypothetical protein [Nonomuraea typhae]|uniref:hypothetical protein n=1 Tax=Nonomuraea typhae TaxID=2603600 RepID=UPI0012FA953F|nr:hypothetical protein [Nonomuraea typhae]